MIKINLLPLEKRRAERTPMPRFMLLLTTVAAACVVLAYLAYMFLQIQGVKAQIEEKNSETKRLAKVVAEHKKFKSLQTSLKAKLDQIGQVTHRNVELYKTLDALWRVVQENPKVWLENIAILDPKATESAFKAIDRSARVYPKYALNIICHAAGEDATAITEFRKDLVEDAFFAKKFNQINFAPEWTMEEESDYEIKNSLSFGVLLYPKPEAPPPRAKKKRKKKKK